MAELLGREPAEMVGFDVYSALDEAGQVQLRTHLHELDTVGEAGDNLECSLLRKDGSRIETLISHTPILDDSGRRRGWLHRVTEYSEQRQLMETLQRREQQLAEAQAIAKVGSWEWDIPADLVSWSAELYRIYDLDPAEFVPTYAGFLDGIHPEDRQSVHEAVSGIFAEGESFQFDARILRHSGGIGWVRGRGIVVRDASGAPVRMSGTAQDITEAKDAEQALGLLRAVATAANNADSLADAVPAAVAEVTSYTAWRAQAAYLVPSDGSLVELDLDREPPDSPDVLELASESAARAQIATRALDDTLLLAAPLMAEGRVAGVIVVQRAGTALPEEWETSTVAQAMALFSRVAERENGSARLAAARDEAMSASRAKSDFLTTMSHEIRTPLNGVIGLSELLGRTDLTERQRRLTEGIDQAGRALLSLVNDILDLSKIEAGRLDLEVVDFDPRAVIEQSASLVAGAARTKALEFVIACAPDLPELVRGDPVRLGQVVSNLTSNAVKFTSSGEVVVRASVEAADDSPRAVQLRIEVKDTGLGIASYDQSRLFEAFSQADSSTTRQFGGSGLGLAISRQIVGAMGGEIGVMSAPGHGSTFWFTATFQRPGDLSPRRQQVRRSALQGSRVLVVDDNETNRLILADQLKSWSADTTAAASAAEGLALLDEAQRAGQPFDVVLLDYLMPEVDGLEFARRARRDRTHEGTRLLLLSSSLEPDPGAVGAAGIDLVMSKPVLSGRLLEAMTAVLGASPVHGDDHRETRWADDPGPGSAGAPVAGRVLLVEDNPVNQLVAEGILNTLGYQVVLAENGEEAVRRFAQEYAELDAVLMDCQMPIMDGYDATRAIRAMESPGSRLPVIALTAAAVAGERERCIAAGMDDFLTKPVDVAVLRSTMRRWVPAGIGADGQPGNLDEAGLGEAAPPVGSERADGAAPGVDSEVLDAARLDELLDLEPGDPTLLLRFIGRFGSNARHTLEEMRRTHQVGTAYDLGRLAHALKGSAANLGAHRLAALCREIELLGDEGAVPDQAVIDRLGVEVDEAAGALEAFAAELDAAHGSP
jgi:PAS domain S-box-containing protein